MHKPSIKRRLIGFLGAASVLGIIWIIMAQTGGHSPSSLSHPGESIPRQIRYSFSLQNLSNRVIEKAEFWTYAPLKRTPTQYCLSLETSHPYHLITDKWGNQILHFTFAEFPPYGSRVVSITADLLLARKPNPFAIGDREAFLKPAKYIESAHPDITRVARELKASQPLQTAQNIFRWIADNLQYAGYSSRNRGALYALSHKKGDCTEFMCLFAALSRANQIPARCVGGYVCRASRLLKPTDYHNWAEFYQAGTWQIADPQRSVFMDASSDYIAMRMIEDAPDDSMTQFNRFRFKGPGLKVKMN